MISSWHPSLVSRPPSSAFAVSADGRFLLTGGQWDYSLRVHSLAKGRTVHIARRHHGMKIINYKISFYLFQYLKKKRSVAQIL